MSTLSPLEYYILHETACGPEPFFVLLGSEFAERQDYEVIAKAIGSLIARSLLESRHNGMPVIPSAEQLIYSCLERQRLGESLEEPSDLGAAYEFYATEQGIKLLKPEHRPRRAPPRKNE